MKNFLKILFHKPKKWILSSISFLKLLKLVKLIKILNLPLPLQIASTCSAILLEQLVTPKEQKFTMLLSLLVLLQLNIISLICRRLTLTFLTSLMPTSSKLICFVAPSLLDTLMDTTQETPSSFLEISRNLNQRYSPLCQES